MYCKYCGEKLDDQARFCSKCGKVVETEKEDFFNDNEYVNPIKQEEIDSSSGRILGFAVWSLVLAIVGFIGGFSGLSTLAFIGYEPTVPLVYYSICIIFPIISLSLSSAAKNRINGLIEKHGETQGRATVGKGLLVPARIVAIIMLCIIATFIFVSFASL